MKVAISCPTCRAEAGAGLEPGEIERHVFFTDVQTESLYQVACPRGHANWAVLENPKFEILFEHGCMALVEGYPREAVSSFAAALERFYEFFIEVVCAKLGVPVTALDASWKYIQLSERQLGAFYFCYLLLHKRPVAETFHKQLIGWTTQRNKAIHQGEIPPRGKAKEYGEWIFAAIATFLAELGGLDDPAIVAVFDQELARALAKVPAGSETSPITTITVMSLLGRQEGSFDERLERLERYVVNFHKGKAVLPFLD
ncbi:MAG: hypothetical protein JWM80_1503 [Cyanobacteria bacterium RYN_339]|nr:hypothetical protein [Cyanobacteria bacterium RYN_339]